MRSSSAYQPVPARLQYGCSTARLVKKSPPLCLHHGLNDRFPVGNLPLCWGAANAASPGAKAGLVLEDAEPVFEVEYRYGCLWSEVDDLLDLDPSRKDLVHPDWVCVLERIGRDL